MESTERPVVLDSFLAEIEAMDSSLFPPGKKISPEDKVIAMASPYSRKLFALTRYYAREKERLMVELKYAPHDESAGSVMAQIDDMQHRESVAVALFWFCVSSELKTWGKNLGIRSDWQIVSAPDNQNPLAGLFGELFGGR